MHPFWKKQLLTEAAGVLATCCVAELFLSKPCASTRRGFSSWLKSLEGSGPEPHPNSFEITFRDNFSFHP